MKPSAAASWLYRVVHSEWKGGRRSGGTRMNASGRCKARCERLRMLLPGVLPPVDFYEKSRIRRYGKHSRIYISQYNATRASVDDIIQKRSQPQAEGVSLIGEKHKGNEKRTEIAVIVVLALLEG